MSLDEFGNVIVAFGSGGFAPQLKRSTCPVKFGRIIPVGKLTVRVSVSVAVLVPHGPVVLLLAAMIMT